MHLSVQELMAYTSEERGRWERWFRETAGEMLTTPIAGPVEANIGQLVMHIFGAELNFVQRLRGEPVTGYRDLPNTTVDTVFGFGLTTRHALLGSVASIDATGWDRMLDFGLHGLKFRVTVRKAVCHLLIHEIRHWAQIARLVRERGFVPPGEHDLLFSGALE